MNSNNSNNIGNVSNNSDNSNTGGIQNTQKLPVRSNPNAPQSKHPNPNLPSTQKHSDRAVKPRNPAQPPQPTNKRPPNPSGNAQNPQLNRNAQARPAQAARPANIPIQIPMEQMNRREQSDQSDIQQGNTTVFNQAGRARPVQQQQQKAGQPRPRPSQQSAQSSSAQSDDGTYNYTGRNIRSNRQKFVNTDDDISIQRNRRNGNAGARQQRAERDDVRVNARGGGFMSGMVKAVLYIIGVVVLSLFFAYNIVMIVNDVFAFVAEESEIEITLPYNANIDELSRILADNNLIRYPFFFRMYASMRGRDAWELLDGEPITVSADMGYDRLIGAFRRRPPPRETIRLTFQEGMTIDDMIDRFIENGMGTRERFEYVINNHRFPHEFLQPLYEAEDAGTLSPYRRFILEGYLFPDTYEFFTDDSEENIIVRFLDNFGRRFDRRSFERLVILDMTLDEIVNLASIVQREARFAEDFSKVSAVFHNRLLNPDFTLLQSDATIMYDRSLFPYHRPVTGADLRIDVPFNTYTRPGLPPSAIGNPGMNAIRAALEPNEDYIGFYFFVSRDDGYTRFARTNAQHEHYTWLARQWNEQHAGQ